MKMYRWNKDTLGTRKTMAAAQGEYAIVRSGMRNLKWSVCRVAGRSLENVMDFGTVRECRTWITHRMQ